MDQSTMAQLLKMLTTPEGKRLLQLMQKDGGAAFSKAAAAAKTGNYALAKSILEPILSGTDAASLAQDLSSHLG